MFCERLALPIEDREFGKTPPMHLERRNRLFPINASAGQTMPTMAFRVGLALRRCGDVDEAEAFFSWSRRLIAERYVADRLLARSRVALMGESEVEPAGARPEEALS